MKNEKAIQAIAAADEQLTRAGLPTYTQIINQAKQLSGHAQTVQRLTDGTTQGTTQSNRVTFIDTDC